MPVLPLPEPQQASFCPTAQQLPHCSGLQQAAVSELPAGEPDARCSAFWLCFLVCSISSFFPGPRNGPGGIDRDIPKRTQNREFLGDVAVHGRALALRAAGTNRLLLDACHGSSKIRSFPPTLWISSLCTRYHLKFPGQIVRFASLNTDNLRAGRSLFLLGRRTARPGMPGTVL